MQRHPAAHTARLDALQRRTHRGHGLMQHGLIASGHLNGAQLRLHRTQGSDRSQAQVTHRAIATAQSLRTPGILCVQSNTCHALLLTAATVKMPFCGDYGFLKRPSGPGRYGLLLTKGQSPANIFRGQALVQVMDDLGKVFAYKVRKLGRAFSKNV